MITLELPEATSATLDAVGRDGPVQALLIGHLRDVTMPQLHALWDRVAPTLERMVVRDGGPYRDLQDLDFARAGGLRELSLQRVCLAPAVLAHPGLHALTLTNCYVGRSAAPAPEIHVGAELRTFTATDCNFYIEHLVVDGPEFTTFSLYQDEDCAEHSIDRITFSGPKIARVAHRAEWPTKVCFAGDLPALAPAGVGVSRGRYSRPSIEVSQLHEGHRLRQLASERR